MKESSSISYYNSSIFNSTLRSHSLKPSDHLSIFHVNSRSLSGKVMELETALEALDHKFDILAFTETWFSSVSDVNFLDGYKCESVYRKGRRGGGCSLYIRNNLNYFVLAEFSAVNDDYESIAVKCCSTVIAAIYRPPSGDFHEFSLSVSKILEYATMTGLSVVLIGDFNINLLLSNSQTQRFKDVIESFHCSNTINRATRITPDTESLIDLCITNHDSADVFSGILTFDISDHLPIFVFVPRPKSKNCHARSAPFFRRNFNNEALNAFRSLVDNIDWTDVYNEKDPNLSYNLFLQKVKHSYDSAFPLHSVKGNRKSRKPWVTRELYHRIRMRDRLFDTFIRVKDETILREYKKLRNKLNSDLRKARTQYYQDVFASISGDPKKIWATIRKLKGSSNIMIPSTLMFDDVEYTSTPLVNKFNDHFLHAGIANNPGTNNLTNDLCGYISSHSTNSIFLSPCTADEICKLIKSLKTDSAAGYDEIKARPIIHVADILCAPLCHICNSALSTGIFPASMKIAKVVVLHKGGSLNDLNNYRPISVLPLFSKVLELVVKFRLTQFLDEKRALVDNQFGFRKNKSTEEALLSVKEEIIENFENRLFTVGVFLDFRKAFDSIKHHILFQKLPEYGIRGVTLELIKSYFSDRFQFVSLNNISSEMKQIMCGVPQGSILGPLFFIIYINDIVNIPLTPKMVLYADDTSLFFSGHNLADLAIVTNNWLHQLLIWLSLNQLQLNVTKTKFIVFKPKNKPDVTDISLRFDACAIERVSVFKFLGVLFEEHLSWTHHVNKLHTSISRSNRVFYNIRHLVPTWLKRQLYYTLIHSQLYYCLLVWGTTSKTNLIRLTLLQKQAVRHIENLAYLDHTAPFFLKNEILKVDQLYFLKLATYIHSKMRQNESMFTHMYLTNRNPYILRHSHLEVPFCRTKYGTKQLKYMIPSFLNQHPQLLSNVYEVSSKSLFKRVVKLYLLSCVPFIV